LEEVLALADRIIVMYEGRIVAEFAAGEADALMLGVFMTGGGREHDRSAAAGVEKPAPSIPGGAP
jgi:ABC-type sugar transport system ATPase subunit